MVEIRLVDTENKKQVKEFVQFHYDLYKNCPQWVPPFRNDIEIMLNKKKHPFYEHSDADFFTAWKDGKIVGRTAVLNNTSYNEYHKQNSGDIFLFDSIDDQEVANALFDAAGDWAKKHGLDKLKGPKGFSLFDGYGVLVEGFDRRQSMNFSCYNFPYYQKLYESYGFYKINEYVTMLADVDDFQLPEKVYKVADIVKKRGKLKIKTYSNKAEIKKDASRIAQMYFDSFKNNWEYFPMTQREFDFFVDNVLTFVVPGLLRFITDENDDIVGFLVNFPDVSAAMQRHSGSLLNPALLVDLVLEMKKTNCCAMNGLGLLEKYHKSGGNALLYCSMMDIMKDYPQFKYVEAVQMAESAHEVQQEMATLGLKPIKRHRVYEVVI
ncbi:MAG: hypothetical protein IJI14_15065 [Anaerolineaceae bacterium]|nr:hypothetical protein [Anaerolineaceae bacterium]